jgi:hypothetical protein
MEAITVSADYWDRDDLLELGFDEDEVESVLSGTALTGHGGQPVVEAELLPELLAMLPRAGGDA